MSQARTRAITRKHGAWLTAEQILSAKGEIALLRTATALDDDDPDDPDHDPDSHNSNFFFFLLISYFNRILPTLVAIELSLCD